jgi:hypothetical protein
MLRYKLNETAREDVVEVARLQCYTTVDLDPAIVPVSLQN